ncbi:MAG: LysM peptidoglycan-binding domain-containing protein [Synergistes sp.]|nr:LysM peptidoglycan-binding domain-containing protein [Synergistes sp.]
MINHTVTKGDSLWKIARSNNISLEDLLALNPQITDANYICVGDVIHVPELWDPYTITEESITADADACADDLPECTDNRRPCVYTAADGETLESIACKFMVPMSEMIYYNLRYCKKEPLSAGCRIIIPAAKKLDPELPAAYEVQRRGVRS